MIIEFISFYYMVEDDIYTTKNKNISPPNPK